MSLAELASWLESSGPWAPAAFIAAYVIGSIALVPGAALTLLGGAVFGLATGVPVAFAGAVLGSSAAFALARTVARDRVARWLSKDARAAAVAEAVASEGFRVVLLLRLSPVFPYTVLNYALGASPVRYRDFLAGSIGMLPGAVLYTYYGAVAGDAVAAGQLLARIDSPELENELQQGIATLQQQAVELDRQRIESRQLALEKRKQTGAMAIEYRWLCADGNYRHFLDQAVLLPATADSVGTSR
mgnify:CR=1 FL=1